MSHDIVRDVNLLWLLEVLTRLRRKQTIAACRNTGTNIKDSLYLENFSFVKCNMNNQNLTKNIDKEIKTN